jgi:hypothetical protein
MAKHARPSWARNLTGPEVVALAGMLARGSQKAYERQRAELETELDELLDDVFSV